MVGHQLTAAVRQTKYLLNIMQSFIAAEMTAVLQVTDVAGAKMFKDHLREAKHIMRQLLARKADEEKVKAVYKCGCYEMMWMINYAHDKCQQNLERSDWVVAAMRSTGMFAWRPNIDKKVLEKADDQAWTSGYQLGSGRIHADWLVDRYKWLDEEGVPIQPQWLDGDAELKGNSPRA